MSLRILHVYKSYYPNSVGGVEQAISQIVKSTMALGLDCEVLSTGSRDAAGTILFDGHLSHCCRAEFELASTPFSFGFFSKFNELARKADIIHYHFPWPFGDLVHLLSGIKKPSIVTYHSDVIKQKYLLKLYRPLLRKFLSSVDCLVATSPNYFSTSDVLQEFFSKTKVIPIGLDQAGYSLPEEHNILYWKNRLPEKFFLFVGVFRYYKGLIILVKAAKKVKFPIVLVGCGPIENEIKRYVKENNIDNVFFLGKVSDKDKSILLTLCYSVVFPSTMRSEAFGISLLEGAMFGKPMISSEIGTGTSFINIHNLTGLIVAPNDPDGLCEAMDFLWNNPSMAEKMGEYAKKRYLAFFNAKKMGLAYFDEYQRLLRIG